MTSVDNVYTFTPSTDESNEGSFSITFRATDGTNVADAISNFSLEFASFAVSLENPSNIIVHGAGYVHDDYGQGPWAVVSDIKGALVTASPQLGSCTFVETINTTTFGDRFYIEMHFSPNAFWGGIGIVEVNNYNNNPHYGMSNFSPKYFHYDTDSAGNQLSSAKVSVLWDVPNGTIKFFRNGGVSVEHFAGGAVNTVVPGEYYIALADGASSNTMTGAYIVTNPDYWTYDPEVLDQL
jgi:hypothetical protein